MLLDLVMAPMVCSGAALVAILMVIHCIQSDLPNPPLVDPPKCYMSLNKPELAT